MADVMIKPQITLKGHQNSNTQMLPINTIVIALNGQGKTRGKVAVVKTETACNQSLGAFICQNELSYSFLFFYLESQYQNIRDLTGEGRNGLNLKILRNINIPIPPLPEQNKIASILTTVDDKISSIDQQIQQTEQLKKGLMEKLLTEGIGHTEFKETKIGRIPKGWDVVKLNKVSKVIDSLHKTPKFSLDGFPMIRVQDINNTTINLISAKTVTKEVFIEFTKNHKPQKGDIVFSRVGSYGMCGYIDSDTPCCIGQNTVIFEPKLNPKYLFYVLLSAICQKQVEQVVTGSTQKTVSLKDIRNFDIPVPPEFEQKKIAQILCVLDEKFDTLTQKKTQYQTLKKGLSQQLLTGQIRVKI